jgi:hypothetical protein
MKYCVEAVVINNGNRSRVGKFSSYSQAYKWAIENRNDGNWQWKICPTSRALDAAIALKNWLVRLFTPRR